jgi:hypothetical protein
MSTRSIGASGSFGGALGNVFDNVNTIVQNALSGVDRVALQVILEAAQQIEFAVANAQNAFKKDLKRPIDKASDAAQAALLQLNAMVDDLRGGVTETIKGLEGRTIVLIQSLPFASTEPKLLSAGPKNLIIVGNENNRIAFTGGFPKASDEDFLPTFTVAGATCELVDNNEKSLTFEIPNSSIKQSDPNQFAHLQSAVLTVPWDNGWVFSRMTNATYRVGLNVLPSCPATRILAKFMGSAPRHEESPLMDSQPFGIHGLNYNGKVEPTVYRTFDVYPRRDWRINVRVLPTVIPTEKGNKSGYELVQPISANCIKVRLWCNAHNSHENKNGWITVVVRYSEERDYSVDEPRTADHSSMKWGDSHTLTPKENEEFTGLVIDDYLGHHTETGASQDHSSPVHLTPILGGKQWKIEAVPPRELQVS